MGLVSPKRIKCIKGDHFQYNVQSAIKALAITKSKTSEMYHSQTKNVSKR
ncbi:hypothetical protein FHR92_003726 [Fontibacillus solani]|uniref:Uncharacterized protein n=1 Tax=Fontibacillus solani TaxID=1572857 RepID=A0A7W3XSZ8_9BACL|nr:hypothetical protein [Fontibacillus solani]